MISEIQIVAAFTDRLYHDDLSNIQFALILK